MIWMDVAETPGDFFETRVVVFGQGVLERDNRIGRHPALEQFDHRQGVEGFAFQWKAIAMIDKKRGGGDVERNADVACRA